MGFRLSGCSPSTTLADCVRRDWALTVRCDACGRSARWSAELSRYPAATTLGDLAERLRCSCGSRDGALSTVSANAVHTRLGHSA